MHAIQQTLHQLNEHFTGLLTYLLCEEVILSTWWLRLCFLTFYVEVCSVIRKQMLTNFEFGKVKLVQKERLIRFQGFQIYFICLFIYLGLNHIYILISLV